VTVATHARVATRDGPRVLRVLAALVLLVATAGCSDPAPPPPPPPGVVVVDEVTGAEIREFAWALAEADRDVVLRHGASPADVPPAPGPGTRILVHVWDHDVGTATGGSAAIPRIPVRRAAATGRIRFEGVVEPEITAEIARCAAGSWKDAAGAGLLPLYDRRPYDATSSGEVTLPAGLSTGIRVWSQRAMVWPWAQEVPASGEAVIRIERPARLRLEFAGVLPRARPEVRFLPDRLVVPPGPTARVVGWELFLDVDHDRQPSWNAAGEAEVHLPPLPHHVLASFGGRGVLTRWDGASESLRIDLDAPMRTLVAEPTLDGTPLSPGSIVAPARLHTAAVAALGLAGSKRVRPAYLVREAGPWRPTPIANAPMYTILDPTRGLGCARPGLDGRLQATTGPCEIVLAAADGTEIEGEAAAWPVWPGDDWVFSRPAVDALRRRFGPAPSARITGLWPAKYRLEYSFRRVGAESDPAVRTATVVVSDAKPRAEVTVKLAR
jgi:hypothetical protein